MKKPISIILSAAALTLGMSTLTFSQTAGTMASVETKAANSPEYKPAFANQTRVAGIKTSTPYEAKVLTEDLKSPWGITSLPDGRFLVTEKAG